MQSGKLAMSIKTFASHCDLGASTISHAVVSGELPSVTPVINGRAIVKRVILTEDGEKWLRSFRSGGHA